MDVKDQYKFVVVQSHNNLDAFPQDVLEKAETLVTLNLFCNAITVIPDFTFPLLENLTIASNKITHFTEDNIRQFPKLKKVDASQNLLKEIGAFKSFTSLTHIDLTQNQISDVTPLTNSFNLVFLSLSLNKLQCIPREFSRLSNLQTLELDNNEFTHFPIEVCACPLQTLSLNGNSIREIPQDVQQLSCIQMLSFTFNHITTLPSFLSNMTSLISLDFDHNPLTSLDLINSPSIRDLILSDLKLDILSLHEFVSLTRLRVFAGAVKQVYELPPIKCLVMENLGIECIKSIPQCTMLSLENNALTSIPSLNSEICSLNLKNNMLTKLPDVFPNLEVLNVTQNFISELPTLYTNLQSLFLGCNEFTEFPRPILRLEGLKHLDLSHNKLTEIPSAISKLTELQQLKFSFNYLCYTPSELSVLGNLRLLNLSHNRLYQIPHRLSIKLRTLLVSSNRIIALPTTLSLMSLVELDVSCNQLICIDCLSSIKTLEDVNCSYNDINNIPKNVFSFVNLKRFTIVGKRFKIEQSMRKAVMNVTFKKGCELVTMPIKKSNFSTYKRDDRETTVIQKKCLKSRSESFGVSECKGNRERMEDYVTLIENYRGVGESLVVLCDGHGGSDASFICSTRYSEVFGKKYEAIIDIDTSDTSFEKSMKRIIEQSYMEVNEEIIKCSGDGTTCLTAFLTDERYIISNVGDCRALLIRENEMVEITKDHRATAPEEYQRVKDNGGFIKNDRTNGVLMVSRSLGDVKIQPTVTPLPDVFFIQKNTLDRFLVLACDGVFDFLSNETVCEIVRKRKLCQPYVIAAAIRDCALAADGRDNVTCVVCKL
ncbi:PH domain leucine-rich repeat-containing protein phosphatase, putative [Entamoeba invadens IP1]|uniref:PH domain leucine-rich repeat-containing protein phosphatase, putative n=1 Tax=Entamoeba invadens IP1 TaxID=370355 RepID=UPI0002C3F810|nr:PH domain leucine-rich repeat-containing protein phosphatase, putative [Entamoeba invadens IP1]ELP90733.1 PH domain leucine-rich repeat-containing protein phosphatase, putative [Entamoeba invadens IP1]|eukprot:XP_004257504.1 PH domain leucine-rich repeat-containing protein phosphatase, putative [Entamoeba invadens IP1]